MSGVLAVWQRQARPVAASVVEIMLAAAPQRAVDGQRVWRNGAVALAHQHFWVTPEEEGEQQPLLSPDARLAITGDVRLDNRAELVGAVGRLAAPAGSASQLSDAELILYAYRQWGVDCVDHLLGEFAFVIWDETRQQLFIARDALGNRSVCYYLDRQCCLVASEVRQLLAHPAVSCQINEAKVADYLVGHWQDQAESFFQAVSYLPPAHCLLVSAGDARLWRYWDIDPQAQIRYRREAEYAEHFLALLQESVACRLRSRGPLGISLSGGLDSTTIAALAASAPGETRRLRSFTYVFDREVACDERDFIRPLLARYDLEATFLPADDLWTLQAPATWPVLDDFVMHDAYARLPLAVMRAAQRAGCRVLLNGHFGDTLFTGGRYWAADWLSDWRWGTLARTLVADRTVIRPRRDLFENGLRQLLPVAWRRRYRQLRPRPAVWTHPGLHPDLAVRTHLQERLHSDDSWQRFAGPGRWERYRTLKTSVIAQGLAAVRGMYHAHGVEPLSPFWDRRLVAFVMAVPASLLGRPAGTKWLLRQAMAGYLPDAIRQRRGKSSFTPLLYKGLYEKEWATVRQILAAPQVVQQQFVRADWLRQVLEDRYNPAHAYPLWLVLSLELWLQQQATNRSL